MVRLMEHIQNFTQDGFKFKDTHIADYGVLVTSCNNTAVENITKELPLENIILDNSKVILHEKGIT